MRIKGIRALAAAMLFAAMSASGAVTPELQKSIKESTFEVVMKKPEKDQVTYEKPLPLDLMPYIERTDAYRSMGTAFALGKNTYVTAGHVIIAAINSQFGPPVLRRLDGVVFEIDRILEFSADEDFVVFSLKNDPNPKGLESEREPQVDQQVLAVGNALGEGIVIRDGLFTSETPEQQDGRWKWIRFSAAASPGNSGGPLCNEVGKVIGVVIGKSQNENLNYALPIARVLDGSAKQALFDQRRLAELPLVHGTITYAFKDQFPLPLAWGDFVQAYLKVADGHFDESQSRVIAGTAQTLFPKGDGSLDILYRIESEGVRPRLITQSADGSWSESSPEYHSSDLTHDGFVEIGDVTGAKLMHLVRPAQASDDAFYGDSKAFMDLALKALDIRRPVGPDKVRVTSLGAAASASVFIDDFGRKWQERSWAIPFFDVYIFMELLPTPDGYDGIVMLAPSLNQHDVRQAGRWLAQHLDGGYSGTLTQWQDMLRRKDLLPRSLETVKLTHHEGWTLETPRVSSAITPEVLSLTDSSLLSLDMGFSEEKAELQWIIEGIRWDQDNRRATGASIWRAVRPPPTANLELRNRFDSIAAKRNPYDGSVSRESQEVFDMTRVLDVPGETSGSQSSDLKYAVTLNFDHYQAAGQVSSKFTALQQGTVVLEHGDGSERLTVSHSPAAEANTVDFSEVQNAALAYADQMKSLGKDIRARDVSDDIRDFMQAASKQMGGKPPTEAQQQYLKQHMEWMQAYWSNYPALEHNLELWSEFLRRNHLPVDTKHSERVSELKTALLVTLSAGYASAHSGERAKELLRAVIDERNGLVRTLPLPADLKLVPRSSPCTAPVTEVSVNRNPALFTSTSSLEQLWPLESKRLGEEGTVIMRVEVSKQGCVLKLAVVGSSGSDYLDTAVLRYAETLSFKPGGDDDGKPIENAVSLPVVFKLTE